MRGLRDVELRHPRSIVGMTFALSCDTAQESAAFKSFKLFKSKIREPIGDADKPEQTPTAISEGNDNQPEIISSKPFLFAAYFP
jgi:hypothetical protein